MVSLRGSSLLLCQILNMGKEVVEDEATGEEGGGGEGVQ